MIWIEREFVESTGGNPGMGRRGAALWGHISAALAWKFGMKHDSGS